MKKTLLTASSKLSSFYGRTFLVLLLYIGFSTIASAQVTTYGYTELSGASYTPITGTNAFGTTTPDEQVTALGSEIPLGFTFNFNGTNYTNIRISANGFITFGGSTALTAIYTPISSVANYTGAVSGYGKNLVFASFGTTPIYSAVTYPSSVEYQLSGAPGSQVFTVQYKNMARYNNLVAPYDGLLNFQIKLFEGNNVVKIVHNTQISSNVATNPIGIGNTGLRGTNSGADWVTRLANAPAWTSTVAGTVAQGINYRNTSYLTSPFEMTWSPPCYAPTATAVGSVTANSAILNWTAPNPAPSGYQYEIRTSGAAGSGATGLVATATVASSPTTVNSLPEGTIFTWYVRSWCGGASYGTWVAGPSFTTSCGSKPIPYFRFFDEGDFLIPAIPPCMSVQNIGLGNNWVTSNATVASAAEQFLDEHFVYDGTVGSGQTQAANVWVFTAGLTLTAGLTYRLSYEYGGSTDSPTITNKMLVKYGTSPTDTGMTILLQDHDNIKTSLTSNNISFTVVSSGTYYIGFKAYSAANQGRLFLDTVLITEPGCKTPTGLTVSSITSSSAQASWTAPSPSPGSGYAYYLSTSNTPPSYSQLPTGFTSTGITLANLTGLIGNTTYYLWVRGYCGTNDFSQWSTVISFATLVAPPYCIPSCVSVSSYISNFTTTGGSTNINNTSGFSSGGYGNYTSLVVTQIAGSAVNFSVTNNDTGGGAGIAIWVDWNNDGVFTNAAPNERVYNSAAYIFGGPVTGIITVPGGQAVGSYRMRIMDDYWATSPNMCTFSATGPRGEGEDYTFTVGTPPPPLTINTNGSAQCAGINSPLITITPGTVGNYQVYSWSPSTGVTGDSVNGYIINSNTSIIYTLTGFNTTTLKTNTATFTYTANPLPTPITISPASTALCQNGTAVLLTATGGNVSGVAILSEDFNTTAPGTTPPTGWVTANAGSGGNPANAALTIVPDASSVWWTGVMHSNDSSQFIFTNGDSQGSGGLNNVTLTSPVFSLPSPGYATANLSFWHFYQTWPSDTFIGVEISTNGGGSWATLQSYTGVLQGAANNFSQVNINLNTYIGQTNLKIRFRYNSTYGYGWAIDNFLISGSANTNTTWNTQSAPVANGVAVPGLYTNLAATVPYLAGAATSTVYTLPTATTTYTASASTLTPPVCSIGQNIVVTVNGGGVASNDQILCSGVPSDLIVTGATGTIQWQYADNYAFTVNVTNIIGATATTLTSAQIGVLASSRYYRAVFTTVACGTTYSNIISIIYDKVIWDGSVWSNLTGPTSTTVAEFQGDYDSIGDISACSVIVDSGSSVTFYSGDTFTVQNEVKVISGTLTFNNNASLVQVNEVTNSGDITYTRTSTAMRLLDYTYWSSPVTPQTLFNVYPIPANATNYLFQYNSSIPNWQSVPSSTVMVAGRGYLMRAPSNFPANTSTMFQTSNFIGVPNNGTITAPIIGSANQWNLLGNPYPSALNIDAFITANAAVGGTVYLWTHNTLSVGAYIASDYALYNYVGGVGTGNGTVNIGINSTIPDGKIASGQGFFIQGMANGTATFTNAMRIAGNNNQFFRMAMPSAPVVEFEKHRYWVDITNTEGAYKQILIGYVESATMGIDRLFDGEMVNSNTAISLYTTVATKKLSIQGRPLPFDVEDTIPLSYKSTISGNYTISLSQFDGLFNSQTVYLEDTLLNVIYDLKTAPYTFATEIGTFDNRFILRYTNSALGNHNPEFNENTVVVYKNNAGLNINTGAVAMKNVTIFDIAGREIASQKQVGTTTTVFTTLPTTQQVLLVKIEGENGGQVTKKVVY